MSRDFLAQIRKTSGCWWWAGPLTNGYGAFMVNGKRLRAHRYSYLLNVGQIPDKAHVHHKCENPACVRPSHLQLLTPSEHAKLHRPRFTHCKRGHEFTASNTRIYKGRQLCRECSRLHQKQHFSRHFPSARCSHVVQRDGVTRQCDNNTAHPSGKCYKHGAEYKRIPGVHRPVAREIARLAL